MFQRFGRPLAPRIFKKIYTKGNATKRYDVCTTGCYVYVLAFVQTRSLRKLFARVWGALRWKFKFSHNNTEVYNTQSQIMISGRKFHNSYYTSNMRYTFFHTIVWCGRFGKKDVISEENEKKKVLWYNSRIHFIVSERNKNS